MLAVGILKQKHTGKQVDICTIRNSHLYSRPCYLRHPSNRTTTHTAPAVACTMLAAARVWRQREQESRSMAAGRVAVVFRPIGVRGHRRG